MSENNLTGYEKRYNAVYNYLDTHKALKNILLLLYKVLPYVTALSYMVLIVLCAISKSTIATPAIALSVDATGYVETSNVFITPYINTVSHRLQSTFSEKQSKPVHEKCCHPGDKALPYDHTCHPFSSKFTAD